MTMDYEAELIKWSNIAYDLADALIEEMLDGDDGPRKPKCWAPCECQSHKALDAWGNAQLELLNRVNPEWKEEMEEKWGGNSSSQ